MFHDRRFVPTERGRVATAFLGAFFADWVADGFTADLERDLDRIAAGGAEWTGVLGAFWTGFEAALAAVGGLGRQDVRAAIGGALKSFAFAGAEGGGGRTCPACGDGTLTVKLGRRGPFVGSSRFPDCRHTRPLAAREEGQGDRAPAHLGADPGSGLAITLRRGRYGLYLQRGEDTPAGRAETVAVPRMMPPEAVTLDVARALLALPRTVGIDPASGKPVTAGIGRYGPWVRHEGAYAPIPADEDVLTIGLNRAVTLLAEKEAASGRRRR